MPDIKKMEGPVKFKKGVELYFDPKKDMFYDPKKKKYVSEKDILALEEVDLFEKSEEYQKFFQSALKKFGIDSPAELSDEKKKEFFDYVDKNWEGENEEDEEETFEEGCHSKHKKIKEDEEFKPHMMYDPKTGKAYKAEKPEDHERMSKLGYTHEKPEKIEERIQEMFDLGDKVKRKDGSEEGEVVQRKIEDKSVGGRYKLKLKNGSRSKWINGNSLELVEQFSQKMEKYVDACGKDFTTYSLKEGKKDYEIYHKTFTSAIEEVEKFAHKNGYEIDSDEMFNVVGTGPKRPGVGKTNKYHLKLIKNGKEDKKQLHFQVYGMEKSYELNMYIS